MKLFLALLLLPLPFAFAHEEEEVAKPLTLSALARDRFGLKEITLKGAGPWALPTSAVLHAGEEKNLYRRRGEKFTRVDFSASPGPGNQLLVASPDLQAGDQVVVAGVGFLRIAELKNLGGAPSGHSH